MLRLITKISPNASQQDIINRAFLLPELIFLLLKTESPRIKSTNDANKFLASHKKEIDSNVPDFNRKKIISALRKLIFEWGRRLPSNVYVEFSDGCKFNRKGFYIPKIGFIIPQNYNEFVGQTYNKKLSGGFIVVKENSEFFIEFYVHNKDEPLADASMLYSKSATYSAICNHDGVDENQKKTNYVFIIESKKENKSLKRSSHCQPSTIFNFKKQINDAKTEICPICSGDGGVNSGCYKCEGTGWISTKERLRYNSLLDGGKTTDNTRISNAVNYGENVGAHYRERDGRIGSNPLHDDYSEDGKA